MAKTKGSKGDFVFLEENLQPFFLPISSLKLPLLQVIKWDYKYFVLCLQV